LGHTIVDPFPTEVPLTSDEWFIRERTLQGLSLQGIEISILDQRGKKLTTESGDMIFTHFGLSGPASLRCSHYVSTSLRKAPQSPLAASIDCLPAKKRGEIIESLERSRKTDGRKHLSTMITQWLPERLAQVILVREDIEGATQMANVSNDTIMKVANNVKSFSVRLTGTLPLAQATVTGGGVSVKEMDPKTMASKLHQGLYFAGEVMDVHGHTGGYNITVAFSTGHCAGTSAALFTQQ